jgi:hypothetical protein
MIIKRNMAVDSLTKVCEESLALIKELIEADNAVYGKGFEDGMAAQAKIQQTLRPWVDLTNDELTDLFYNKNLGQESAVGQAIALLKEKNQ